MGVMEHQAAAPGLSDLHSSTAGGPGHVPTLELPGPHQKWRVGVEPDVSAQVRCSCPADLLSVMSCRSGALVQSEGTQQC